MSDFFAGVYGARFPDVVMNQGPLPNTGGLPAPLHDTPDGKINYNSSLLGDLSPYAYGEPGFLSSQTAYLNIPHRIQKIVPYLYLPEPDGTGSFQLSHPIDDGDVAFTITLDRNSEFCTGLNNKSVMRAGLGTAIDPMINLVALNYILAGVQLSTHLNATRQKWDNFLHHLDRRMHKRFDGTARQYSYNDIKHIVRNIVRPFGIAHGSEKQGGQHEGSMSPVTWPVNFVISLVLDGKDANMVNLWYNHPIEAGNDLVLRLKPVPLPPNGRYTLNHYAKGLAVRTFGDNLMSQVETQVNNGVKITHLWQLVPDVFSFDVEDVDLLTINLPPGFNPMSAAVQNNPLPGRLQHVFWQEEGYWHIARTQIHSKKYGIEDAHYNDMANKLRTGHMDVTFQPTFYAMPYRDYYNQNGPALVVGHGPNFIPLRPRVGPAAPIPLPGPPNVINFLGERKRDWSETLHIEKGFTSDPMQTGSLQSQYTLSDRPLGSRANLGFLLGQQTEYSKRARTDLQVGADFKTDFKTSGTVIPVNHSEYSGVTSLCAQNLCAYNPPPLSLSLPASSSLYTPTTCNANNPNFQDPNFQDPNFQDPNFNNINFSESVARTTGLTEDIGTFEELPPLSSKHGGAEQQSSSQLFQIPKPGIRSAKRPSGRSKGVLGALLGTDGSVRQEESRML
jgi:hypothetical protein